MQPRQLACTYTLTLICVPGGDPRAPKQCRLSFVRSRVTYKCASCLPAQSPAHRVHTRRCCSCCCSHFSCCCCLLLSLQLVICRCVRGRLRVRTNKYCNDVCDFFYAPMCYTKAAALPTPLPAYQFIEISLGRPATTTWHSTRAKFVVGKICNIHFNEVTTWQRVKKRVIKNMLEKINKQSTAEMY